MIGDALVLHPDKNKTIKTYLDYYAEIEKIILDPSKPEEDCNFYGEEHEFSSLSNCFEETLHKQIYQELGCNIPWMSSNNTCVGNVSKVYLPSTQSMLTKYRYELIQNLDPFTKTCKVPCVSTQVNVRKLASGTSSNGESQIHVIFHSKAGRVFS